MKRFFSSRIILGVLVIGIMLISISLFLYATIEDDIERMSEECMKYCSKYSGPEQMACYHGCMSPIVPLQ